MMKIIEGAKTGNAISEYVPDWGCYFANVDGRLTSIAVDLALGNLAPVINQANLVCISIQMANPRLDGLLSKEESGILGEIESELQVSLEDKFGALYCGRSTSNSVRDLYYYLDNALLYDKAISELMVKYPNYQYDYGIEEDPEWGFYYDFLYPLPVQLQSILNRRIIECLSVCGDRLTNERPVTHQLYFRSDADRNRFLSMVKVHDFDIAGQGYYGSHDYPYGLQVSRIDKVDLDSVEKYVLQLWKLTKEVGGDYDGWETTIE